MYDINEVAHHTKELVQSTHDSALHHIRNASAFAAKRSKTFWIVLGSVLVLMLGSLLHEWWRVSKLWKRYINCPGCYARFYNQIADCSGARPTGSRRLTKPHNGYTYSMWLYVADWYGSSSFGKWKSVYYKGAPLDRQNRQCGVSWDSMAKQQPGVWMSDTHNNLRVAVSTAVTLPEKCLADTDGKAHHGSSSGPAPGNRCTVASSDVKMKNMYILEYADIDNFPIGQWFQLLFVVTSKRLELYLNGKLVNTVIFTGQYRPLCDKEDGHFASTGHTFKGRIHNFRYMPHALPYQMISKLYNYESQSRLLRVRDPMDELSGHR